MSPEMKPYCQKTFIAVALFLITGCRQAWQLDAGVRDSDLIFAFPEEAAGQPVELQAFQVLKRDCAVDCVFWSVKSGTTESGEPDPWTVVDGTIVFGKSGPELETVIPARKPTPGVYSASGTVSLYEDGRFSGSRTVFAEFELSVDNEGRPMIRR